MDSCISRELLSLVYSPPAPLIQSQVRNKESCLSENTYHGSAWSTNKKSQKQTIVNTFLGILLKSRAKSLCHCLGWNVKFIYGFISAAEISMLLGFGWHSGVQSMEGEGDRGRGNVKALQFRLWFRLVCLAPCSLSPLKPLVEPEINQVTERTWG